MIVHSPLPPAARKADLWRTYAELPDSVHTLLADALAQHMIAASPDVFAMLLGEAGASV